MEKVKKPKKNTAAQEPKAIEEVEDVICEWEPWMVRTKISKILLF